MNSPSSLGTIVRINLLLVLSIGLYGFFTDEPYWREVGHRPWLYDYLFWIGLGLNGPSGFAAEYLSWVVINDSPVHGLGFVTQHSHDWRFLVQYVLWSLLLWPQWKAYDAIARWSLAHRRYEWALYTAAAVFVLGGGVLAYAGWAWGHRPSELVFIDQYFWFVRRGAVALSGVLVVAYYEFTKRRTTLHSS